MSKNFELTDKVTFVRMTPDGQPIYGSGVVVAKLIGVSSRINYSVRDEESLDHQGKPKAWNLEPEALNGSDEENAAYVAHYLAVSDVVARYDAESKAMVKKTNDEIDAMHDVFFGPKVEL
jgi:hypothetical protein